MTLCRQIRTTVEYKITSSKFHMKFFMKFDIRFKKVKRKRGKDKKKMRLNEKYENNKSNLQFLLTYKISKNKQIMYSMKI